MKRPSKILFILTLFREAIFFSENFFKDLLEINGAKWLGTNNDRLLEEIDTERQNKIWRGVIADSDLRWCGIIFWLLKI